jgi:hypothetical protein
VGDALGDSAGSGPKEVPTESWPGAARDGEIRAPPTPGGPCAPFGLEGSGNQAQFSQLEDSGGLSTFGDSPPAKALFIEGFGLMSWGTLHRGSRIKKIVNDETYL